MTLYENTSKGGFQEIKENPFKLERDLQKFFEENLPALTGLELVKSEFSIRDRRIDTLAYDRQTEAFSIIEYKRNRNSSVIDQGFAYLSLVLDNKAELILHYNETLNRSLRMGTVDWSQTRVVFVSPSFTDDQIQATNFKDIAIELWEVKQFKNGIISVNPIKKSGGAEGMVSLKGDSGRVREEIKPYTEQDHLEKATDSTVDLYEKFKMAIMNLTDGIEVKPQKHYIAFKKGSNITDIEVQKNSLKMGVNLKKGQLSDPKNITKDVSSTGHLGNGDYQIQVTDDTNLEYIMSLIKQAIR